MKDFIKSMLTSLLSLWITVTLDPLPFKTILEGPDISFEAFRGYLQFLMAMFFTEIFIQLFSMARKQEIINSLRQAFSQEREKRPSCELVKPMFKKAILYVPKLIFISAIYYFVYIILFSVVCSAFSIDIQQRSMTDPEISLQPLERTEMEKSEVLDELGNTHRQLAFETFESSLLYSTTGRYFSTNTGRALAMALSNDGNTAFLCTNLPETIQHLYVLNIVNISNIESPSLLASVPLTSGENQNIFNLYDAGGFPMTMLLLPGEQTLFMATGPTIEIFNVSNLTSPFIINSYSPIAEGKEDAVLVQAFAFTSDANTMAISFMGTSYYVTIVNITNLLDPSVLYSKESGKFKQSEVHFYEELFWISPLGFGTTWEIYNISNLTHPQYVMSLDLSDSNSDYASGVTFSSDYKTIFTCYTGVSAKSDYCNIFDITNLTAPTQYPTTIPVPFNFGDLETLALSPDNRYLFVTGGDFLQIFDVSNLTSPVQLNNISISFPTGVIISADGRRAIVSTSSQVYSVELYFNFPISGQVFNMQDSLIGIVTPTTSVKVEMVDSIALSPNGDILYVGSYNNAPYFGHGNLPYLRILNVSDPSSVNPIQQLELNVSILQLGVSPDGSTLFVTPEESFTSHNKIEIYNAESYELLSSYYSKKGIQSFTVAPNGNTLFAAYEISDTDVDFPITWTIINITNLRSPSEIGYYTYDDSDYYMKMAISSDGNTAFLTGSALRILNISDLLTPTLISNYTLVTELASIKAVTISPDNQTVFLATSDGVRSFLEIVNISSLSAPTFLSLMDIPNDLDNTYIDSDGSDSLTQFNPEVQSMEISPDGKTLFIVASGLAILNVSNLTDPRLLDFYSSSSAFAIQITPDYSTAFLADYNQGVIALSLKPFYIFNMPITSFPLGKTISSTLNVLAKNPNNTYDASLINYKFIGLSLYSLDYEPGYTSPVYNFTALPNWMDFDTTTGVLTVSPPSNTPVGSYSLYGALSTCVEDTAFLGVANITTMNEASQMVVSLIGLGYLDNQGFLTPAFNPNQPLVIGSRVMPNETEIRKVMAKYYIEAMTSISVDASLTLALGDLSSIHPKISINTLSLSPLNLQIALDNTNNVIAKFVDTDYSLIPSFTTGNTVISVVGSLLDINLILSQLVIFLNSTSPCNGTITVSDGLNYPLNKSITNISAYFSKSSQPLYDASYFQSQIDKVSIVTGTQFIIQFDYSTFQDLDGEDLTYTIAAQDSHAQVPDWITLRGLDLIGTPPLQLSGRDIPLKIVASNQYQSVEAEFTMHVGISFMFALKLIAEYGGALITVLGLIIYIDWIYNILCKRLYRYPIDFRVEIGEEITSRTIYPIAFIREPLLESRLILKKLDKKIAAEIKSSSKSEIANYFRLETIYQIDKANLTQCIEQVAIELLSTKAADKLELYVSGINSRKELIEQLIFKEMTMRLIDLKEQKQTKLAFKSIKGNLFSLVKLKKYSEDGICEFSVVRSKLYEQLQIKNIAIPSLRKNKENNTKLSTSSLYSKVNESREIPVSVNSSFLTIQPQGVNIDLLFDIVEAYAFKYHNMNADLLDIKINVKEQIRHISRIRAIKSFFKRDLTEISFVHEKRQLGYGLQHETRKGFLKFCGEIDSDMKNRTLAIQITNLRGRILREIWVHGVNGVNGDQIVDDEIEEEALKKLIN